MVNTFKFIDYSLKYNLDLEKLLTLVMLSINPYKMQEYYSKFKHKEKLLNLQYLMRNNFIEYDTVSSTQIPEFNLTDWGYNVVQEIVEYEDPKKESSSSDEDSFNSFIENWLSLWPTIVTPGGYRISGNTKECYKRMRKFVKENPQHSFERILEVTENYLDRQAQGGYSFTKKNAKFIYDREGSTLESELSETSVGDNEDDVFFMSEDSS